MRKEYATGMWRRLLGLVCNGQGALSIQNPAIEFMIASKSGEYDKINDTEYNERLADAEDASVLWDNNKLQTAEAVLLEAMRKTTVSSNRRDSIAEILAICSEKSTYRTDTQETETSDESEFVASENVEKYKPRDIYDRLNMRIRGQDAAKRAAAMIVYAMLQGHRSNAVMCGPTGSGKTEIWRQIARWMPDKVRIFDASRLSGDGWKGSLHLRDVFEGVQAQNGMVVILDEADKICCEAMVGAGGTDYAQIIQNSLLKMLDGDVIQFGREDNRAAFEVDCSHVSVVLLGAFERLLRNKGSNTGHVGFGADGKTECDYGNTTITQEDLISAGMRREIAARIHRIIQLRPLGADDYRDILFGSVLPDLQAETHSKIDIDNDSVIYLIEQAAASGLGVRWMTSQIRDVLDDLIFDDPEAGAYVVNIATKRDRAINLPVEKSTELQLYT